MSDYVCSKLREALSEDDASEAIDRLATAGLPLVKPGSLLEERIHLGIVKLVCDPWSSSYVEPAAPSKFHSALELAKADWRDLLVAAGLEHDDWPQALGEAGYRVPRQR